MLSLLPLSPPAASYTLSFLAPHRASEERRRNLSRVDPLLALAVSGALLDGQAIVPDKERQRRASGIAQP